MLTSIRRCSRSWTRPAIRSAPRTGLLRIRRSARACTPSTGGAGLTPTPLPDGERVTLLVDSVDLEVRGVVGRRAEHRRRGRRQVGGPDHVPDAIGRVERDNVLFSGQQVERFLRLVEIVERLVVVA